QGVADARRQRAAGTGTPPEASRPAAGAVKAGYDLSVDVIQAQANSRPATVLIAADQALNETFHLNGDDSCRGVIAALPDLFDEGGKLTVHARRPGDGEWVDVGDLRRPGDPRPPRPGQGGVPADPRPCRLTLGERG